MPSPNGLQVQTARQVWKFILASVQSSKPKMFFLFIHSFQNFGFSAASSACVIFSSPLLQRSLVQNLSVQPPIANLNFNVRASKFI